MAHKLKQRLSKKKAAAFSFSYWSSREQERSYGDRVGKLLQTSHLRYTERMNYHVFTSTTLLDNQCDYSGQVFPHEILAVSQEAAARHVERFGLGRERLFADYGVLWMISGLSLYMTGERPCAGEELSAETWAHDIHGLRFLRDHRYYRGERRPENVFATSLGEWFFVDAATRKPLRPLEVLGDRDLAPYFDREELMGKRSKRVVLLSEEEKQKAFTLDFHCAYRDLDSNRHLNNCRYLAFACDTVMECLRLQGEDLAEAYAFRELHLNYAAEVLAGETLRLYCKDLGITEQAGKRRRTFLLEGDKVEIHEPSFRAEISLELCHNKPAGQTVPAD